MKTHALSAVLLVSLGGFLAGAEEVSVAPSSLPVVTDGYPRVFFFRQSEGLARQGRLSFDVWEQAFSRLMGIEGKVLDEEVPGTSANNIEFFVNFKRRHPDQLVLLHFNGNARDPRFESERFFAGHWIYHVGSKVLSDVPAEEGTTEIQVEDPSCYLTGIGRYRNSNDDIGLCELDESGRPDWSRNEQVQLVAVNPDKRTILVKRGCYGTKPRRFMAGRAYAAAHATEGPWGRNSHLLWYYNYATCCPRDKDGRTCADVLVAELGQRFGPGGELALFDGLEFDVLHHQPIAGRRPVDCDADGKADGGVIDGVNVYGIGVIRFLEALRARLGEDKLILADGQQDARGQRGFGLVNGIESEGFPTLRDWEMKQWSTGINRHNFWSQFGRPPVFHYINHKYVEPGAEPGMERTPEVPFSTHRLVFAAAVMTDAAICYSFAPPKGEASVIGVWDEFWAGREHRLGWLGKPLGPAQTLAVRTPDTLASTLSQLKEKGEGANRWGTRVRWQGAALVLQSEGQGEEDIVLEIPTTVSGNEAYMECVASAEPRRGYPKQMARYATCALLPRGWLMEELKPERIWMERRGESRQPLDPATGAIVRLVGTVTLEGTTRTAIQVHPPYRGATGCVGWEAVVIPKKDDVLHFSTGMGERAPGRSDGVLFRVEVEKVGQGSQAGSNPEVLFETLQVDARWRDHQVSLTKYEGCEISLRFVADAGPRDNGTTDHGYWGNVWLGKGDSAPPVTSVVEQGTWLGRKGFSAGFFFPELKPGDYWLRLRVEGPEPVRIEKLALYHAADARYRVFEHGVVLANPSLHEVTFDLRTIVPGRKFRRIKGRPEQDPVTNSGAAVEDKVVVPARDALFLMEE